MSQLHTRSTPSTTALYTNLSVFKGGLHLQKQAYAGLQRLTKHEFSYRKIGIIKHPMNIGTHLDFSNHSGL